MRVGAAGTIRVLHVDDDPDFADLTATFLEREDERFAVETATSASEGLDRLARGDVDCVVSDYEMPGRNGIEFLRTVREDHPDLPFLLFTGKGSEEVASEAVSAGVTDYLQKGAGTDQYTVLTNRVANAVEHDRSRRRAERNERRLREIIDALPHLLYVVDAEGTYLLANETLADFHGTTVDELEGANVTDVLGDDVAEQFVADVDRVLESGDSKRVAEVEVDDATGETHVFAPRLLPYDLAETDERAVLGIAVDVTERAWRERRLEALNETTQELMGANSREQVVEAGVEAAHEILGLDANAVYLAENGRLTPVAYTDATEDLVGELPTFTDGDGITWRVYEQGEPIALDDVHDDPDIYNPDSPVRSQLFLPLGAYGILVAGSATPAAFDQEDVVLGEILAGSIETALEQVERTEQLREREAELTRQNERLEEFTSIVSHDLRNPLNVADGRLEMAREEYDDSDHLDAVARAHDRMAALIDDLLTLAREGERVSDLEPVDLAGTVRNCWATVATSDATLVVETDRTVRADASRLRQLFENLLRNAVEHGGDDVTITVGDLDGGFYVEDDGPGIPEDERDDVFDPGHSTSQTGTGFGLTIVEQIADAHGWEVAVTEGTDGGARFEFTGV